MRSDRWPRVFFRFGCSAFVFQYQPSVEGVVWEVWVPYKEA